MNVFKNDGYKDWLKFREKFRRKANPEQKAEEERIVVIKEACGNGCISLGISFILVLFFESVVGHITEQILCDSWYIWFPIVVVTLFLIFFLGRMHRIHVQRQYDYMKQVIEDDC
jgi:hypothetical protein